MQFRESTIPWSTTRDFPRFDGVESEHTLKGFGQSCGAERHSYVDTTNEDRFVCIHIFP